MSVCLKASSCDIDAMTGTGAKAWARLTIRVSEVSSFIRPMCYTPAAVIRDQDSKRSIADDAKPQHVAWPHAHAVAELPDRTVAITMNTDGHTAGAETGFVLGTRTRD
jgi:hypothetical protein